MALHPPVEVVRRDRAAGSNREQDYRDRLHLVHHGGKIGQCCKLSGHLQRRSHLPTEVLLLSDQCAYQRGRTARSSERPIPERREQARLLDGVAHPAAGARRDVDPVNRGPGVGLSVHHGYRCGRQRRELLWSFLLFLPLPSATRLVFDLSPDLEVFFK